MTYQTKVVVDELVSTETRLGMGDGKGDYIRLWQSECREAAVFAGVDPPCPARRWSSTRWWAKVVVVCLFLLGGTAAFIIWGLPLFLNKIVIPTLDWERKTFCTPVLGLLLFASIALFPTLLIPSSPSMWLVGITFGYGYGFLLIIAGTSLGMSLPFFIGSLFHHRLHRWLEKWPKRAAIVRLAGEGDWFHQFRAVILLRISPFPYIIFNYAAVATNVKYCPYILGSLVGIVPEIFITIYSGILIRNLADVSDGRGFLSLEQIIYDVIGFCIALAATIAITAYAKKTLQTLQAEDELA